MEDTQASIAAVSRKEEAVEQALSGQGSYLGMSLGGAAGGGGGERKELLMHLQALRDEKRQLRDQERENAKEKAQQRDEEAKDKAHAREETARENAYERGEKEKDNALEREKALLRFRLEVQLAASASEEKKKEWVDGAGDKPNETGVPNGGCATLSDSGDDRPSCAKALGVKELYEKVMELVGKGEYAFVATVCKKWRAYYIVAHPAKTSQRSVVASIERVYWARRHGYELTVETFRAAARYGGDVSMCKALRNMGCPWGAAVCRSAALNERYSLRMLKWLRSDDVKEGKCPWDSSVCDAAAGRGDIQLLEWLLSDDVYAPFDDGLWCHTIGGGQISVLAWLLSHPWVRAELEEAEEGSEWRKGSWHAAMCSQLEALRWLHANAWELCEWGTRVCQYAVTYGKSLEMLQWLRSEEVGCPWDKHVCPGTRWRLFGGPEGLGIYPETFKIKDWVHANGHPCDCED